MAAMFVNGQDEMSNLYRGPFKFHFIWLSGFIEEKLTDDRRQDTK